MATVEFALPIAAAINAAMLATALGVQAFRKKARAGFFAALYLLAVAGAIIVIAADHGGFGFSRGQSSIVEGFLTFVSGPLFLLFAATSLGARIDPRMLSAVLAAIAVVIIFSAQYFSIQIIADRLVFVSMAFTARAAWIALSADSAGGNVARRKALVLVAVAGLSALHAAQLVRTFWPEIAQLRNIVPSVGALAMFALSAAVYFGGRLGFLEELTEPPSVATKAMRTIVARMEEALASGLLKKSDLTSADAAAELGVSAGELVAAMRAVTGDSFSARLQKLRVEEAQRLLVDPKEARTSMEAIGLLAGFGSRSAFYQAFRERVSMSPAEYRRSAAQKPVQKAESGQD